MSVSLVPVKTVSDQELLARIAGEIWRGYWPDRIGSGQTEYMIEKYQSLGAIQRDMADHDFEYWFIVAAEANDDGLEKSIVGFTGGYNDWGTNRYHLSKIYLFPEARGHGYARRAIEFYEDLCFVRGLSSLYLMVNKYNDIAIRAYKGTGFEIVDTAVTDIGEGYVMDDYIMELKL